MKILKKNNLLKIIFRNIANKIYSCSRTGVEIYMHSRILGGGSKYEINLFI